jgi:tetrahedral aminopeptidase
VAVDVDFLRDLSTAPGVSGHEEPVQRVVRDRISTVTAPEVDAFGDVLGEVNKGATPQVVVTGHADQIGFVVTHVDDSGFVYFRRVGGWDPTITQGREYVIHTGAGLVAAVSGKRPTHLIPADERRNAPDLKDQWLDIGAANREEAERRVRPGDPVTVRPRFVELAPDTFAGPAFDDRAGVYVAVRALERYAENPGRSSLLALSTVGEETVSLGARGQALRLHPQCTIVVDGDFATDQPELDAKKSGGVCELGKGPVIARGSCSNKRLFALACEVAKAEGIPFQVKAYVAPTQTDADELQVWPDVANLNLAVPMRYMHSPFEVVRGCDAEWTAQLAAALVRRIGEVYAPGYFVTLEGRPS